MAQDPEEGFKITDRRRRDDDEPARPQAAPAAAPPPRVEPPPSPPPAARPAPPPPALAPEPAGVADERNLSGLFMMLATEAVIALGDAPDPVTGQRHRELPHAAGVIDLLALLREKTEGNRTPDETQMLDELLYDLQLRYVRAAKSAG